MKRSNDDELFSGKSDLKESYGQKTKLFQNQSTSAQHFGAE